MRPLGKKSLSLGLERRVKAMASTSLNTKPTGCWAFMKWKARGRMEVRVGSRLGSSWLASSKCGRTTLYTQMMAIRARVFLVALSPKQSFWRICRAWGGKEPPSLGHICTEHGSMGGSWGLDEKSWILPSGNTALWLGVGVRGNPVFLAAPV